MLEQTPPVLGIHIEVDVKEDPLSEAPGLHEIWLKAHAEGQEHQL